jgi:ribosomal protein S18 acetylase RimI-like enzyme
MNAISPLEEITRNCYRSFSAIRGAELIDEPGLYGVLSRVPVAFFSGIASTDLDAAQVPAVIDRFRAARCPFRWWISPWTRPSNLEEILIANGMRHAYDSPGMVAELGALDLENHAGVDIRRLEHASELSPYLDVIGRVFSKSTEEMQVWGDAYEQCGFGDEAPWQHFVAFVDDGPVATTSVLMGGDVAGIYMVGTLTEARGRGIGAAVTREAMRFARVRGATQAALQSSELGYGVYRNLGFADQCLLRLYEWRPKLNQT